MSGAFGAEIKFGVDESRVFILREKDGVKWKIFIEADGKTERWEKAEPEQETK